jgi:hypothetical protein
VGKEQRRFKHTIAPGGGRPDFECESVNRGAADALRIDHDDDLRGPEGRQHDLVRNDADIYVMGRQRTYAHGPHALGASVTNLSVDA